MGLKDRILAIFSDQLRENIALKNELGEVEKNNERNLDEIFNEFISVIDTFDRSEQIIKEKELDKEEDAQKAIKRLLNAKRKALGVLEKFNVKEMVFDDNKLDVNLCVTVEQMPDPAKENDTILSMEINCKLFDDGKLPDMEAIRKTKILVNAIIY